MSRRNSAWTQSTGLVRQMISGMHENCWFVDSYAGSYVAEVPFFLGYVYPCRVLGSPRLVHGSLGASFPPVADTKFGCHDVEGVMVVGWRVMVR